MVLAINEQFMTTILVTDENNNPASGKTINYRIFDENRTLFDSGTMTEIGSYGIYYKLWTPDAEGYWIFEAYYSGSDFHFYDIQLYQVSKGVEDDIYDLLGTPAYSTIAGDIANLITRTKGLDDIHDDLATHDTDIKTLIGTPTADLATDLAAIENKLKAAPSVDSILFKSGGATCPTGKSIWDALGDATINLNTLDTEIDALENKLKASPSVDSILFKSGGAVCPVGKSIWDALGDGTVSLNTINNLLTDATYGLSALETLVDEVESLLKNATYGLSALNDDLDTIITRIGDPSLHTLTTITDKLGDLSESLATILETFVASESGGLGDRIAFIQQFIGKGSGTVLPANKSLYDVIALDRLDNGTYGLAALNTDLDAIISTLGTPVTDIAADIADLITRTKGLDDIHDDLAALQTDIGDFSARTYLSSLLAILGWADVLNVQTLEERLGYQTSGSIESDLSTILSRIGTPATSLKVDHDDIDAAIAALNDLSAAEVNAEVDTALADINLDHLVQTASTINDTTPTADNFNTALTETTDDHYNGLLLMFTSGNLAGQARTIVDYDGSNKTITVHPSLTEAPSNGDAFVIFTGNYQNTILKGSKGLEQIYDLVDEIFNLRRIGDTITADGTEQTVYQNDSPSKLFEPKKAQIDLSNMQAGDVVIVREYYRVKSGGSYLLKDSRTFSNVQTYKVIDIDLAPCRFGVKITIEQTAGTNRSFDWEIFYGE